MNAQILDGKRVAAEVLESLAPRIRQLPRPPGLAVVLVGSDPRSVIYVRNKGRKAESLGLHHVQVDLPIDVTQERLLTEIARLNRDPAIHGILVQQPLPRHIDDDAVLDAITPDKDVDGFHPVNVGLLSQKRDCLVPCTPAGVMELLRRTGETIRGRDALVIGRSNIVGKPVAQLLLQADCSVTVAHSRTRDLAAHVARAEILVAAVGVARMVRGEWIRPGSCVIDVGMNQLPDGSLCGDVDYAGAVMRAAWITPVPGGVGPMTIAMLMVNTVNAAERLMASAPETRASTPPQVRGMQGGA